MRQCQPPAPFILPRPPLPNLWLVSDARNDAMLEIAIARLPRGSGLIFRHYHLDEAARRARFARLARMIRARGGLAVLAGSMAQARRWGADGAYGSARLAGPGGRGLRLVTAHGLSEIRQAGQARADGLLLSPAFATRSHPGASALGVLRWRMLATRAATPVIALGGMSERRARRLGVSCWAAIDGLVHVAGAT